MTKADIALIAALERVRELVSVLKPYSDEWNDARHALEYLDSITQRCAGGKHLAEAG